MEVRLPPTPVQTREFRAAHASARPQEHAQNPETRREFAEDHRSVARARKAKRRLRRLFAGAKRNARGPARLGRDDEYEILRCAYQSVRAWQRDGVHHEIERELRAGAEVAVSCRSSLFLLLIRCSLPPLDIRRASKWAAALEYADRQGIKSKRLPDFLWRVGGVEAGARARAAAGRRRATGVLESRCDDG
jgi:hypothetical protein